MIPCRLTAPETLKQWLEDVDPQTYLKQIDGRADIFTFWDRVPDNHLVVPEGYDAVCEQDNIAAVELVSFDFWFNHQIGKKTRYMVKKARNLGIETRVCCLDDELIRGIERIYNHSPTRQGVPFTHYGESFTQIKEALDRNRDYERVFIGAFFLDKMIGFSQLLYSKPGDVVLIGEFLSMQTHWDKGVSNALIAAAVSLACSRNAKYLVYNRMRRKTSVDSLESFKVHNGFKEYAVKRYYVPLTLKGQIVLRLKLHHGLTGVMPQQIRDVIYSKNRVIVKSRVGLSKVRAISNRKPFRCTYH